MYFAIVRFSQNGPIVCFPFISRFIVTCLAYLNKTRLFWWFVLLRVMFVRSGLVCFVQRALFLLFPFWPFWLRFSFFRTIRNTMNFQLPIKQSSLTRIDMKNYTRLDWSLMEYIFCESRFSIATINKLTYLLTSWKFCWFSLSRFRE